MRKLLMTFGLTSLLIGAITFADPIFGHVRVNVNLGGPPVYQAPPPIYQTPPPVYEAPPPVYEAPQYGYYQPQLYEAQPVIYSNYYNGWNSRRERWDRDRGHFRHRHEERDEHRRRD